MENTMKKKYMLLIAVVSIGVMVFGMLGTGAFFVDTENTQNNAFVAGTLDLKVNGGDVPVTIFNISNMAPDAQPTGRIILKNTGSITGNLSISGIVLKSYENACWEPESEMGDMTCDDPGEGLGELQNVLGLRLYVDADKDGYFSAGDVMLYSGMMSGLPAFLPSFTNLATGQEVYLNYVVDWWDTANDNLAQSDGVKLDMTFRLAQQNH
jgi:hypothetical protein